MSHPGNDEIIDNERDKQIDALDPSRHALINEMVHHATKMGIGVVQEIAAETIKRKPGCTIKELMKVLDKYLEQPNKYHKNNPANTNE